MRQVRPSRGWWGIVALAGLWACETARNPSGTQFDLIPPAITLTASADTQQIASGLQFTVSASDNLSLKDIQLTYSGGYIARTHTAFTYATMAMNQPPSITSPANSGAGGWIKIVGRASDGAGNFATDSITIFLSNVQALTVTLLQPVPPAVAASGKNIPVQVEARQLGGIATVGFIITPRNAVVDPTTPPTDSLVFTPPARQPPDTIYTDTLTVQNGFTSFTVTAFAVDAGGVRGGHGADRRPTVHGDRGAQGRHGERQRGESHDRGFDVRAGTAAGRQCPPEEYRRAWLRLRPRHRAQLRLLADQHRDHGDGGPAPRAGHRGVVGHGRGHRRRRGRHHAPAAAGRAHRGRDLQREPARAVPHQRRAGPGGSVRRREQDLQPHRHRHRRSRPVGHRALPGRHAGPLRR